MIMKFEMPKFDIYSFDLNENIAALKSDVSGDEENISGPVKGSNVF